MVGKLAVGDPVDITIQVNDAEEAGPIEEWVDRLVHEVHEGAAEHFGRGACRYRAFGRGYKNDRAEFASDLEAIGGEAMRHLAEWDHATRPVAVIHWQPAKRSTKRRLDA